MYFKLVLTKLLKNIRRTYCRYAIIFIFINIF